MELKCFLGKKHGITFQGNSKGIEVPFAEDMYRLQHEREGECVYSGGAQIA